MLKITSLRQALPLTLLLAAITFAGCSSSTSSTKKDDNNQNKDLSVPINGIAAKGILQGALVEACATTACDPVLASATTDIKGAYSLNMPAGYSGVVILRLKHQAGAKMVCDVAAGCNGTAFGQPVDMEPGLVLRTATNVDKSSTTVSAPISPLTELVVNAALASNAGASFLNMDAIHKGSDAVKKLLGLSVETNLMQTQPIDITKADADISNPVAVQLSALAAAFADTASNESLSSKMQSLAKAVSGGSAAQSDLEKLTTSAKATLDKAASTNPALNGMVSSLKAALEDAGKKATESCVNFTCAATPEGAVVDPGQANTPSNNIKAVKDLVADVRALGWEVYPALRDAADPTKTGYNDSLIGQADDAAKILNADAIYTYQGPSELLGIILFAYLNEKNSTVISDLAKDYFVYSHQDEWEYSQYYKDSRQYCFDDPLQRDEDCERRYPEKDLAADTAAYGAQFSGTLIKSGNTWQTQAAKFSKDNKETNISKLEITFPAATPSEKVSNINAAISLIANYAGSNINLNATATAKVSEAISAIDYEAKPFITEAKVTGDATVSNTKDGVTRTFTGKAAFEGGTTTAQQNKNQGNFNRSASFLPKSASLEGKFTSSNYSSGAIEAKVSASIDNYNSLSYHADALPVNIPAKLTLSQDQKTLAFDLGSGNEQVSFTAKFLPNHTPYCKNGYQSGPSYKDTNGKWQVARYESDHYIDSNNNKIPDHQVAHEQGYDANGSWVKVTYIPRKYVDVNGNDLNQASLYFGPVYKDANNNWTKPFSVIDGYYTDSDGNHFSFNQIIWESNGPGYYLDGIWVPVSYVPPKYFDVNGHEIDSASLEHGTYYQSTDGIWQKATYTGNYYVDADNNPVPNGTAITSRTGYYSSGVWTPVTYVPSRYVDRDGNEISSNNLEHGQGYKDANGDWQKAVLADAAHYVDANNNRVPSNQDVTTSEGYYANGVWTPVTPVSSRYLDKNGNELNSSNIESGLGYKDVNGDWHKAILADEEHYVDANNNRVPDADVRYESNGMGYYLNGVWTPVRRMPAQYQDENGNKLSFVEDSGSYYKDDNGKWQQVTYESGYYKDANNNRVPNDQYVTYSTGYYANGVWTPVTRVQAQYKDLNGNILSSYELRQNSFCAEEIMLHAIQFSQCTIKGIGDCGWYAVNDYKVDFYPYYSNTSLTENSSILDALNRHHDDEWSRNYFYQGIQLKSSSDSWVRFPTLSELNTSQFSNGILATQAVSMSKLFESADNFVMATVTAEVKGKLSANLPEVNLKLTAKRSEFSQANADLVIAWKQPGVAQKVITLSAKVLGHNGHFEDLDRSNLNVFISDAKGTQFQLSDIGKKDDEVGFIMKDGTKYATVSKNNKLYYVVYHYDDNGNKNNSTAVEFESLF